MNESIVTNTDELDSTFQNTEKNPDLSSLYQPEELPERFSEVCVHKQALKRNLTQKSSKAAVLFQETWVRWWTDYDELAWCAFTVEVGRCSVAMCPKIEMPRYQNTDIVLLIYLCCLPLEVFTLYLSFT